MLSDEPTPRKDLFLNKDAEAWCAQFHMLFYVLGMSPDQIAQIDYGLDTAHPDAWMACSWAAEIRQTYRRVENDTIVLAAAKWARREAIVRSLRP